MADGGEKNADYKMKWGWKYADGKMQKSKCGRQNLTNNEMGMEKCG